MALTQTVFLFWGIDLGSAAAYDSEWLWDGWHEPWAKALGEARFTKERIRETCRLLTPHIEGSDNRVFALAGPSMISADPWTHTVFDTPVAQPAWTEELKRFTSVLGLPWREPSWILACEWSP